MHAIMQISLADWLHLPIMLSNHVLNGCDSRDIMIDFGKSSIFQILTFSRRLQVLMSVAVGVTGGTRILTPKWTSSSTANSICTTT